MLEILLNPPSPLLCNNNRPEEYLSLLVGLPAINKSRNPSLSTSKNFDSIPAKPFNSSI